MITLRDLTWLSLAASGYGSNDVLPTFSAMSVRQTASMRRSYDFRGPLGTDNYAASDVVFHGKVGIHAVI